MIMIWSIHALMQTSSWMGVNNNTFSFVKGEFPFLEILGLHVRYERLGLKTRFFLHGYMMMITIYLLCFN